MATAVLMAKQEGYKVVATMRNLQVKENLEKAAGESLDKTLFIRELDVANESSIMKFIKETYELEGRIDILVNNAGIAQFGAFELATREQIVFQTNYFGEVRLTQEVAHEMKKRRDGKIIYVSSMAGVLPLPIHEHYNASKHALEGFVAYIAPILQHFNISVTSVQPGATKTSLLDNAKKGGMGELQNDPKADDETNDCMQKVLSVALSELMSNWQTPEEVAHVIKKCIEDEQPPVMIQTSAFLEEVVRKVIVDPSGIKARDDVAASFK